MAYTYDANGNITGIGSRVLTYNQNNRLIRVEENSTVLGEYTYNGMGQRVVKEVDGVTTVFHYDFNGNIIAESDQSGNIEYEYLYKVSSRLALVDVASGEIYSFLNDRLGTPQMLADSTNTVVWEGTYKPFGEADVNPNSSVVNNFRFPGQYYDAETGLHYNYFRYYDPATGRYLTPDPIGLVGGINLFLYADGNPINLTDPNGLIVGSLSSKFVRKMVGQTAQEAALSGKMADAAISAVITFDTNNTIVPKVSNQIVGDVLLGIQGWGTFQTASLAGLSAASAPAWLPIGLAGLAGLEIGSLFNELYERLSGQSLGEDIYDWLHPQQRQDSLCE